jgi:hypothetical protein
MYIDALLAAATLVQAPSRAGTSVQEGRIVVSTGTHWRLAMEFPVTRSFRCDERRISYRLRYEAEGTQLRIALTRLTIDGRNVRRDTLERINGTLAHYAWPPEIRPMCAERRIALQLEQVDSRHIVRSETIEVSQR